ncbi:MAG: hypothetical protein KC416_16515, partial [Myxococcales bacterium]|nr:hypothetical protein [Myxococcales bacterium]
MDFSKLVEARIMDFQRRKARGDVQEAPELTAASGSLEVQLISEIRALRRGAKEARDPDEKRATLTKAAGLQT